MDHTSHERLWSDPTMLLEPPPALTGVVTSCSAVVMSWQSSQQDAWEAEGQRGWRGDTAARAWPRVDSRASKETSWCRSSKSAPGSGAGEGEAGRGAICTALGFRLVNGQAG